VSVLQRRDLFCLCSDHRTQLGDGLGRAAGAVRV
jgi:hypothetical protein